MNLPTALFTFFLLLATGSPLMAQNTAPAAGGGSGTGTGGNTGNSSTDGNQRGINGFWEVVTSGGRFVARLDRITSVSEQEYLIDGAVRVYECTVDTDGGQTARFYYLEPITDGSSITTGSATVERLKNLANQVSNKAGAGDIDAIVTKHYPDTTHAKTSEYRVRNRATISQIYDHVRRVWAEERGQGKENMLVIRNG
ncbi:MAG: hypothetical protein KGR69_11275 [Verrucomicrobia bacterium]|nr:hypothetical protein [Verrucomicrobiota bacterium]